MASSENIGQEEWCRRDRSLSGGGWRPRGAEARSASAKRKCGAPERSGAATRRKTGGDPGDSTEPQTIFSELDNVYRSWGSLDNKPGLKDPGLIGFPAPIQSVPTTLASSKNRRNSIMVSNLTGIPGEISRQVSSVRHQTSKIFSGLDYRTNTPVHYQISKIFLN